MKALYFDGFPETDWHDRPLKPVEAMEDGLEVDLDMQRSLMLECRVQDLPVDIAFFLTIQALIAEATEAGIDFANLTKPWKTDKAIDLAAVKMEMIDIYHYWLQGCEVLGMDADEIRSLYASKNRENFRRIAAKMKAS